MSNLSGERLYDLLPAVYRVRDAEQGEDLRALLGVIEHELRLLEKDVDRLYDNLFIETCDEWVVPYLGDLLGVHGLRPRRDGGFFSQRALVANTLAYRRRKGTAAVLEQLARDVTGWSAKAVEFFELLATTQHLNHVRPGKGGTMDLRPLDRLGPVGNPFERAAHTADVRHVDNGRGKYNIPNVGLFLWRLQPYPVVRGTARAVSEPDDGRYRFSPLGADATLYNRPQTETEIVQLATERNVPDPLRRRPLYEELEARRQALVDGETPREAYFGKQPVLQVFADGNPVFPEEISVCDLSDAPPNSAGGWRRPAAIISYTPKRGGPAQNMPIKVAVDPVLGRLAWLVSPKPKEVQVSYAYGFPGDLGGGPYERRATLTDSGRTKWEVTVSKRDTNANFDSLAAALAAWTTQAAGTESDAAITITDNATYTEAIGIKLVENRRLTIQAAHGTRPVLRCAGSHGDLALSPATGAQGANSSLTLNGLLIEGGIRVGPQSLELLRIVHCTLVPGCRLDRDGQPLEPDRPSVSVADPNDGLQVEIDHSITGPLRLPTDMEGLRVRASIIDSPYQNARMVPALISQPLSSISLSSDAPAVNVTIGDEGPHRAPFPEDDNPNTLPKAREQLQRAIREVPGGPTFKNAQVIRNPNSNENHLIVLPGVAVAISIEADGDDPTASELGLTPALSRKAYAFVGGPLSPFPKISSPSPSLRVAMGDKGSRTVTLTGNPQNVAQARDFLQEAIRGEDENTPQAFLEALVANTDDGRLVVMPGIEGVTVTFNATPADRTTISELGLESATSEGRRSVIAASEGGGDPGPTTTLERTTVFGTVYVKELNLASEVVFTDLVKVLRRQAGCARFSYVPDGSLAPRRFRCQPDLAAQKELEPALKVNPSLTPAEQARIRNLVGSRVRPSFTSVRYGEPGYAQLVPSCAAEIRTGAEDENEMGAFNFLRQEERIASMLTNLDGYLRLGLEAGILLVN